MHFGPNLQFPCSCQLGALRGIAATHLCEILAWCPLCKRLVGMEKRTGFAGLAGTLTVELARHMRGAWEGVSSKIGM